MGDVLDDIAVVVGRADLDGATRRRLVAQRRAAEWVTAVSARLPIRHGQTTVTGVSADGPTVTLDGNGGPISWPLRIVNPPVTVPDPDGPATRGDVRRRVDPVAALRALLTDLTGSR